jgi:uncharacterized protein YciW
LFDNIVVLAVINPAAIGGLTTAGLTTTGAVFLSSIISLM